MKDFNFTPYRGGGTKLVDEIRLYGKGLILGFNTMEKLGHPTGVRVLADKAQRIIRVEAVGMDHPDRRALHPTSPRGGRPPRSWRISVSHLAADLPPGRYYPIPNSPMTFTYEGGQHGQL